MKKKLTAILVYLAGAASVFALVLGRISAARACAITFAASGQVNGILIQLRFQEPELYVILSAIVFKRRLVICLGVIKSNFDHLSHPFRVSFV